MNGYNDAALAACSCLSHTARFHLAPVRSKVNLGASPPDPYWVSRAPLRRRAPFVCPLTTDPTQAPIFRLSVQPSAESGLRAPCRMMVDKLTAVPRRRLGRPVGSLASEEVKALNRAIFVFWVWQKRKRRKVNFTPRRGPSRPIRALDERARFQPASGRMPPGIAPRGPVEQRSRRRGDDA